MNKFNFKFVKATVIIAGVISGSLMAQALEADPFVLTGKVTSSTDKTVTMEIGEQEAEVPMKLVPKAKLKDGKIETGSKLTIALTEEQSKQVKIRKR